MNFYQKIISNQSLNFIDSIEITHLKTPCQVNVSISNQRIPDSFDSIDFNSSLSGDKLTIKFKRPVNYLHFKIEINGVLTQSLLNPILNYLILEDDQQLVEHLSKSNLSILGCARNCSTNLKSQLEFLRKIGENFASVNIIIFENDSIDDTFDILNDFKSRGLIELYSVKGLDSILPLRTQRLSYARNLLKSKINYSTTDYVIVADLDGVIDPFMDIQVILDNFKYRNCWDVVFPVNKNKYYDIWALRHKSIMPFDYEREMNKFVFNFPEITVLDFYLNRVNKMEFNKMRGWLSVESAFGGMGIYSSRYLQWANYRGFDGVNQICEHVSLHADIRREGGRLFINPNFVINGVLNF